MFDCPRHTGELTVCGQATTRSGKVGGGVVGPSAKLGWRALHGLASPLSASPSALVKSFPPAPPMVASDAFEKLIQIIGEEDFETDFKQALITTGFKNEGKLIKYASGHVQHGAVDDLKAQIIADVKLSPLDAQILAGALFKLSIV